MQLRRGVGSPQPLMYCDSKWAHGNPVDMQGDAQICMCNAPSGERLLLGSYTRDLPPAGLTSLILV
jgi:hypothetical protein